MIVRTVRDNGTHTLHECSSLLFERSDDRAVIHLSLVDDTGSSTVITLPDDGHTAYIMSKDGGTVDKYTIRKKGD